MSTGIDSKRVAQLRLHSLDIFIGSQMSVLLASLHKFLNVIADGAPTDLLPDAQKDRQDIRTVDRPVGYGPPFYLFSKYI